MAGDFGKFDLSKLDLSKVYINKCEKKPSKYGFGLFASEDIEEGELVCLDVRESGDPTFTRAQIEAVKETRDRETLQNFGFMVLFHSHISDHEPY